MNFVGEIFMGAVRFVEDSPPPHPPFRPVTTIWQDIAQALGLWRHPLAPFPLTFNSPPIVERSEHIAFQTDKALYLIEGNALRVMNDAALPGHSAASPDWDFGSEAFTTRAPDLVRGRRIVAAQVTPGHMFYIDLGTVGVHTFARYGLPPGANPAERDVALEILSLEDFRCEQDGVTLNPVEIKPPWPELKRPWPNPG